MRRLATHLSPILGALLLAGTSIAAPQDSTHIVRAGKVWTGDGKVLEDVRIRIKDGKIASIEKDEGPLPSGVTVHDFRRATLMPGLIAAYTDLVASNQPRNLTPDLIASEQFDFYREYPKLVRSGLTSVYLSPGSVRLMAGQGSVVKLAGKDVSTRLLKEESALRVHVSPTARRNLPPLFEPTYEPTADDPLVAARKQRGTTRASQLQVLRKAFTEAKTSDRERGGDGYERDKYMLAPLRAAMAGELPIRLAAWSGADILHGLDFLSKIGARAILERPMQAAPLKDRLAQQSIPAIVQMPLRPAQPNAGDFKPGDEDTPRLTPGLAGELARAGVTVAIVPQNDADLDKLRMLAGLACRYGMPASKALGSVTLDAAKILGVDARIGSIAPGKDADFVVLSGAPFDARTQVEKVFVDGMQAWATDNGEATFALRAGRVLVGDGTEHRDAAVLVRGGKIVYVGPQESLPPGAEIIDASDSVLVPGIIAAATRLGLHSDSGTTRFPAATSVDIARALRSDDPAFRHALEAGVTSLFVTPDDAGLVGGRVCAVKTHGESEGFVVRDVTGLRMSLTAGGKAGKAQLVAAIKKAKDYVNPKKKPAPKKTEKKEEKPKEDPISGSWDGQVSGGPLPAPQTFKATMELDGEDVTGSMTISVMPLPIEFEGTYKDKKISLEANAPAPIGKLEIDGTLGGNGDLTGTIKSSQGSLNFTMKRTKAGAKPTPVATAAKTADSKKNESLEPWRKVLKGEAPLVVRVANGEACKTAIETIAVENKLKLVLAGNGRDILRRKIAPPKDTPVGFIVGCNEVLFEEKGKKTNVAQGLAELGYELILVARAQVGTRYLPVHAAWAVTEGLDPRKALGSITGTAATCFGLSDRIGRLAEGCDADMVLMSGDPFDLTTHVRAVWVDGVLRVDHMETNNEKENR